MDYYYQKNMALEKAIPILAYLDDKATIDFYTQLGFSCNNQWEEYLMFSKDSIDLHLWKCNDPGIPKNTGCYIRVSNIERLYQQCMELSCIHPNGDLEDKPWEMRQFSILDNSGNIIHFGQDLS